MALRRVADRRVLLAVLAACSGVVLILVLRWAMSGFAGLQESNALLALVHFLGTATMAAVGLLSIHTLKKAAS